MAEKSAAAKKRARQRKKANLPLSMSTTGDSGISSEEEVRMDRAQIEHSHSTTSSVTYAQATLQIDSRKDDFASDQTVDRPCFEINLVPGKGQRVRALKDIPRGTRIISEKPLFSIPQSNGCNPSDIQAAFEMLSPENKSRFELHGAHIPNHSRVESTFGTNSIEQSNGAGIFLTISRTNHSCLPNTHFSFNEKTGEETVQAIKDVKAGEEILISYCKPFYTAMERQKQLKQYAFQCTCEACEPKTSFWRNSDRRRSQMSHFNQDIVVWDQMPDSATWLTRATNPMGAIEGLIDLLEQEGLMHGSLSRTYADAAKWSKKLGRHTKAKIWAQR